MVNSIESETKNRYELMTRILPDGEITGRTVSREIEDRQIDDEIENLKKVILDMKRVINDFKNELRS